MTLYGPDISNHQERKNYKAGDSLLFNVAGLKQEGFDFLFCKVSEGDYYADPTWPAYRDAAKTAGLVLAGYHYVIDVNKVSADRQADLFVQSLSDKSIPAMLDFESNSGNIDSYWAVKQAIEARGVRAPLAYIPRWYWASIGNPDISKVPVLIQSTYVNGTGYASNLYPGDNDPRWSGFGGKQVDLLQFTNQATIVGQPVDCNAFRGTIQELQNLLGAAPYTGPVPPITPPTPPAAPPAPPVPSAPSYPLPPGYYFGPLDGPANSISCQAPDGSDAQYRHDLQLWQQRMIERGWGAYFPQYGADGMYGETTAVSETYHCALQFQQNKGLVADGMVGPETWPAAWTLPVT